MEKNTNINMSNESSAHNDINKITLKKKVLNGVPEEELHDSKLENINTNQGTNTYNSNTNDNKIYGNNKDDFKPKDPNYHSGIIETKEVKKDRKPSVLIIFIILVAIFFGEIIYKTVTNKNNPNEKENNNNVTNNQQNDNTIDNNVLEDNTIDENASSMEVQNTVE